jgi:hypothetical protein
MKRPVPLESASARIYQLISKLLDWRGKMLASPVWSHDGVIAGG